VNTHQHPQRSNVIGITIENLVNKFE